MISPEEYASAVRTNDGEFAFVQLESKFRAVLETKLEKAENNYGYNYAVIEYMNHTLAAAKSLGLEGFKEWEVPSHSVRDVSDRYRDFVTAVDHFKVQVQIRNAKSYNRYSVALDGDEKDKIRSYVSHIKKIIDECSLGKAKKERLYSKINAFLAEVDRDRTRFEQLADLTMGLAHLGAEAAEELEPVRKLLHTINVFMGRVKEFEDSALSLPPYAAPARLPAPPKQLSAPSEKGATDLDDDIPF
ncbi:MAG: hypothetical protein P4L80_01520 [Xanthobacteraceae bacterium]|nr:hypothetical protein [Xanthobacteraceae bacterium]